MEKLYTVRELAEVLTCTRQAIYKWMKEGRLSYVTVGSERRVPQSAVDAFIKAGNPEEVIEGESEGITIPGLVAA